MHKFDYFLREVNFTTKEAYMQEMVGKKGYGKKGYGKKDYEKEETEVRHYCELLYNQQKNNILPVINKTHIHGKECYSEDVNFDYCWYKNRFYQLVRYENNYAVISVNHEFIEPELIIANINFGFFSSYPEKWDGIFVNDLGVFIYKYDLTKALHYDFNGNLISKYAEKTKKGTVHHIYIQDNKIFYVVSYDDKKDVIRCMDIDEKRIIDIYSKASNIYTFFIKDSHLFFYAEYCLPRTRDVTTFGWMTYNMEDNQLQCLSNPFINPEEILSHPDFFDNRKKSYNKISKYHGEISIAFFDFQHNVFWRKVSNYLIPYELFGDRNINRSMPIWKTPNNHQAVIAEVESRCCPSWTPYGSNLSYNTFHREYFDGHFHFYSPYTYSSFEFYTLNMNGEQHLWDGTSGHGFQGVYRVMGDYLYIPPNVNCVYSMASLEGRPVKVYGDTYIKRWEENWIKELENKKKASNTKENTKIMSTSKEKDKKGPNNNSYLFDDDEEDDDFYLRNFWDDDDDEIIGNIWEDIKIISDYSSDSTFSDMTFKNDTNTAKDFSKIVHELERANTFERNSRNIPKMISSGKNIAAIAIFERKNGFSVEFSNKTGLFDRLPYDVVQILEKNNIEVKDRKKEKYFQFTIRNNNAADLNILTDIIDYLFC